MSNRKINKTFLTTTEGSAQEDDRPPIHKVPQVKKKSQTPIRIITSITMVSAQCFCYSAGHIYYALLLIYCGTKACFELQNLTNTSEKKYKPNLISKILDYMIPYAYFFYLCPKTFIRRVLIDNDSLFDFKNEFPMFYNVFFVYHSLICCALVCFGLVLFTLSLEKGSIKYQFKRLGWQIVTTIPSVAAGLFFGYYCYKGFFWVIITNGSVMINDIMAFVFGKLFGRTPLIKLSPNKTWEGFIGGGISTILFAIFISGYIS